MRINSLRVAAIVMLVAAASASAQEKPVRIVLPAGTESPMLRDSILWRRQHHHEKAVTALAYVPRSQELAAASMDGSVRLWDTDATKVLRTLVTSSLEVYAIAVAPDGKTLVTAGSGAEIQAWEIATGKLLHSIKAHDGPVAALAYSPDGKLLASGGYDKSIRLWDAATWKEKAKFTEGLDRVTCLAFSPDGKRLASGGTTVETVRGFENGTSDRIRLWEVATGKRVAELPIRGSQVSYFPDGRSMIAAGHVMHYQRQPNGRTSIDGHSVTTWYDLITGGVRLNTFKLALGVLVSVSSDGSMFATGHGYSLFTHLDGSVIASDRQGHWGVRVWESESRKEFHRLPNTVEAPQMQATSMAFAHDSRRLAISYFSGLIEVRGLSPHLSFPLSTKGDGGKPEWDRAWTQLGSADAEDGFSAIFALLREPSSAVLLISKQLHKVAQERATVVARLIVSLDHSDYPVRQDAEARLRNIGIALEQALQSKMAGASTEARVRLLRLLSACRTEKMPPEHLRATRAVTVLERIATPQSMRVLKELADGAPGFFLTEDAKAALRRMQR